MRDWELAELQIVTGADRTAKVRYYASDTKRDVASQYESGQLHNSIRNRLSRSSFSFHELLLLLLPCISD